MISFTLPPSLIVLLDSIKLFEHWLLCYYLLIYRMRLFSIHPHDENVQKIGGILHPFD
jgi:hypothetical protein